MSSSIILPVPPKRAKLNAAGIRTWNGYASGIPGQLAGSSTECVVLRDHPNEPVYLLEIADISGPAITLWIPIKECIPLAFDNASNRWVERP